MKVALVAFEELFLFGHVALTGENRRFVHDVDTGSVNGERRNRRTEITDNPVEVLADIAFDIEPLGFESLGSCSEVFLHTAAKAHQDVGTNTFVRTEAKVQVSSDKFIAFHIRHRVDTSLVLISREARTLGNSTNATANFNTALCIGAISLGLQGLLIISNSRSRCGNRCSKKGD